MLGYSDYASQFPDLVKELLVFFSMSKMKKAEGKNALSPNTVGEFISYYKKNHSSTEHPAPRIATEICDKLCALNALHQIHKGYNDVSNSYLCMLKDNVETLPAQHREILLQRFECAVYGFTYIYERFQSLVVPIIHFTHEDDITIGTGFYWNGGIATAKHCLEGAKCIAIKDISKEQLNSANIYISENINMDLAFIDLKIRKQSLMISNSALPRVLEEIITMGYPKIPGFTHFQTVEKATISALPQKRFTATTGSVAAVAPQVWVKENLFLITAKIRGGNSGGPVINSYGDIIGIVSEIPFAEGNYDDLGYGTAIPISFIIEIADKRQSMLSGMRFTDYVE